MARLEIPALYRIELGNSKWGWHKMTDLVTAVDHITERLPEEILPPLDEAFGTEDHKQRLKGKRILLMFGHLNRERLFAWTDELEISFDPIDKVPWDRPNLFVPARWSLEVIETVKNCGRTAELNEQQLFEVASGCLNKLERGILQLRLGLSSETPLGVSWTIKEVAEKFKIAKPKILNIEYRAIRKMKRYVADIKESDFVRPLPIDSVRIEEMEFSVRTCNCLSNAGLITVGMIRRLTLAEMLKLRNFGKKSLREISDKLLARGIDLHWF